MEGVGTGWSLVHAHLIPIGGTSQTWFWEARQGRLSPALLRCPLFAGTDLWVASSTESLPRQRCPLFLVQFGEQNAPGANRFS